VGSDWGFQDGGVLMGLQGEYTKYPSYLCLWDSRPDALHYVQKEWPARTEFTMGSHKVKWDPLIAAYRVLMPPRHIKLGLMKQFVKGLKPSSCQRFEKTVVIHMLPYLRPHKNTRSYFGFRKLSNY